MKHLTEDLLACTIDGCNVILPKEPLQDYPYLRKVLIKAGGKYKTNTFVFPNDAQPYIDKLTNGESVDLKKEFQFFETPKNVFVQMYKLINKKRIFESALEPSAGQGAIANELRAANIPVAVVELMDINRKVLREKGYIVDHDDFMTYPMDKKFDLILANPPFTKGQDVDHICKMYNHLNDGGEMVSIASAAVNFNSQKKYAQFRNWAELVNAKIIDLPEGSFKSSETNVNTVMIHITK